MNYYYNYVDINPLEQNIKLDQAQLKLAKLEGADYKIEECKRKIKVARKKLLIAKAKMEINKQVLVRDLMLGREIKAVVKKEAE